MVKEINISDVNNIPALELGYLGENEVIQVNINYDDWVATYGQGTLSLLFKRPGDSVAYPIILPQDNSVAQWIITNTELSKTGVASAQLVYTIDEQIKKSAIFSINIKNSLDGGGDVPDPFQSWLDEANQVLDTFENMEVVAETLPAGSDATASYTDGTMTFGIPQGEKGETGGISQEELEATLEDFAENGTVANAEELVSSRKVNNKIPYLFRATPRAGDRAYFNAVVGASAVVNQKMINGNFANTNDIFVRSFASMSVANNELTVNITSAPDANFYGQMYEYKAIKDHKVLALLDIKSNRAMRYQLINEFNGRVINLTANTYAHYETIENNALTADRGGVRFSSPDGFQVGDEFKHKNFKIIDLTAFFGSATVADYLYNLETATAGAGVAKLKEWGFDFSNLDYTVNTLKSIEGLTAHKTVGLNQWDEEWELGLINGNTGENGTSDQRIRSKNYIRVIPDTSYRFTVLSATSSGTLRIRYYDDEKRYIGAYDKNGNSNGANTNRTMPSNCHYVRFDCSEAYGVTYKNDICIFIHHDSSMDGTYEPYWERTYPLDEDVTLRGRFDLDANNNLYAIGDRWLPSGEVKRRFSIDNLGSLAWEVNPNASNTFTGTLTTRAVSGTKNAVCQLYIIDDSSTVGNVDKAIAVGKGNSSNKVYVHDSAYTDATTFKTAMSEVYFIYEKATPTTEEAEPYTSPQRCDNWGTEEFITSQTNPIPIGHDTDYPISLKDKIESYPDLPSANGTYLLKMTNGVASWVAQS